VAVVDEFSDVKKDNDDNCVPESLGEWPGIITDKLRAHSLGTKYSKRDLQIDLHKWRKRWESLP
jgi:hypothetical protein